MNRMAYDIAIIGGGPAGTTCALALKNSGLKVVLLEKATFPRDKVCGDAIPGLAVKTLRQISPQYAEKLAALPEKHLTKRTRFWLNDKRKVELSWVNPAYTCKRIDFDQQLFEWTKAEQGIEVYENCNVQHLAYEADGVTIQCANQLTFHVKMVVGADGAQSIVNKQLTDFKVDLQHYGGAIRAYYLQVEGLETDCTEVYISKKHLPGYFWLFPLPNQQANAGFGMLSEHISKHRINLKEAFYRFIEASPMLQDKLKNSTLDGKIVGFGLPFGSKQVQVSGAHFLLLGDAASLVDPVTGEGIGNAVYSGKLAAEHLLECFKQQRFDAIFNESYKQKLYAYFGTEFRQRTFLQRSFTKFPWLLDVGMVLGNTPIVKDYLKKFA